MTVEKTVKLTSGHDMPVVGLGTWQSKPGEVGKAVEAALLAGYKHIDCAWIYGNQKEIGEVFGRLFSSTIKREDVFVTSKVWNTFHSYDRAKASIDDILSQLQLSYLDLLLIHWPMGYAEGGDPLPKAEDGVHMKFSTEDYLDTWRALEDAVKEGKVRSIGISNFNHKQIQRVLDHSTIKPAVLQVELHPHFQQKKLRQYCKDHNIRITAYSSLGNPGSTMFRKEGDPNILTEAKVLEIAKAHNKSAAQVALRWAIQHGILVIPKSTSADRIKQNADIFDFSLTEDEMATIDGLDKNWRIVDLTSRDSAHPHFPFLEEF